MSREHADVALAAELIDGLRERLADELGGPDGIRRLTPHRVARALRESGRPVGDATVLAACEQLRREVSGAGVLEPLLGEPGVTDVLVNGHREVYVDRGRGLELQSLGFPDDAAVRRLAQRLAAQAGRRLDDAMPHVDARLPDGTRLHAVLAPVARPGTVVSLRVPGRRHLELRDLRANGSIDALGERLLRRVVRARLAFVVSGGTGSGKTTLLGAMLGAVPEVERIVIVEDSSELRPAHPHVVGLEARPANIEGQGEITVRTLVRQALRMRPDRLVVGEVRGGEVVDLLAALNTGHEGGCGTIHANGAAEVVARIEALAQAAGLPREAAHSQLAAALHVVLHLGRDRHGRRALTEVAVPVRRDDGLVVAEPALSLGRGGLHEHRGAERLGALLERAGPV